MLSDLFDVGHFSELYPKVTNLHEHYKGGRVCVITGSISVVVWDYSLRRREESVLCIFRVQGRKVVCDYREY